MCQSPRQSFAEAGDVSFVSKAHPPPPAQKSTSAPPRPLLGLGFLWARVDVTPLLPVILVAAGVVHALMQEQLMQTLHGNLPMLVTTSEFACCAVLSLCYLFVNGLRVTDAPRGHLFVIAILVLGSLVSGNMALSWVSYPVKVVIKSCKLLPTMALGGFLLRKRYALLDQAAAVCLCAGIVGFTLADADLGGKGKSSSPLGVALLVFAVCCDAVQVLLQERMLRGRHDLTPMHVMAHTNGFAFFAICPAIFATGEHLRLPESLPWGSLLLYGSSSWVGVCCFISLTRSWGATAAVIGERRARRGVSPRLSRPQPLPASCPLRSGAPHRLAASRRSDEHAQAADGRTLLRHLPQAAQARLCPVGRIDRLWRLPPPPAQGVRRQGRDEGRAQD